MNDAAFPELTSGSELDQALAAEDALVLWFSTPQCNVCKVLRPRVEALVAEQFPKMKGFYVDAAALPEVAGQLSVFTVPTVVVFFGGREWLRKARNFSLAELASELERPYAMATS